MYFIFVCICSSGPARKFFLFFVFSLSYGYACFESCTRKSAIAKTDILFVVHYNGARSLDTFPYPRSVRATLSYIFIYCQFKLSVPCYDNVQCAIYAIIMFHFPRCALFPFFNTFYSNTFERLAFITKCLGQSDTLETSINNLIFGINNRSA